MKIQKTPGTVWVAFVLGLVALVQQLWPESQYQTTVVVVLVGNFLAGMLEAYWPLIERLWAKPDLTGPAYALRKPVRFASAFNKALWG